jgi:hypothetical protein
MKDKLNTPRDLLLYGTERISGQTSERDRYTARTHRLEAVRICKLTHNPTR